MARLRQTRLGFGVDRFDPHQVQQPHHPLAIDVQTLLAQKHRQLATAINRMVQMQLVQPSHQAQVLLRLRAAPVIIAAPAQVQQLALVPHADLRVGANEFVQACQRPSCLDFFLSQSRSTVS